MKSIILAIALASVGCATTQSETPLHAYDATQDEYHDHKSPVDRFCEDIETVEQAKYCEHRTFRQEHPVRAYFANVAQSLHEVEVARAKNTIHCSSYAVGNSVDTNCE